MSSENIRSLKSWVTFVSPSLWALSKSCNQVLWGKTAVFQSFQLWFIHIKWIAVKPIDAIVFVLDSLFISLQMIDGALTVLTEFVSCGS